MFRNLLIMKELFLIKFRHDYMVANCVYPMFQSAFRPRRITETALVRVTHDILLAMNSRQVTLLVLLDLSTTFDNVIYEVLLKRLHTDVGIWEKALDWFKSYLNGRSQRIAVKETMSRQFDLDCSVHVWDLCYALFFHRTSLKLLKNILHLFIVSPMIHNFTLVLNLMTLLVGMTLSTPWINALMI